MPDILREKWNHPDFTPYCEAFPDEHRASPEAFEAHVKDLTERDVKIAYLKNLQGERARCKWYLCKLIDSPGYLWQAGYENGAYSTPLFPDVTPQLRKWKKSSIQLAIYSSGSIFAQKLLFGHVKDDEGQSTLDLKDLISDWFDTTNAGPKAEASSYTKIAEAIGKPTTKTLFLSDNVKEVKAALDAGMKAVVVDRPGNGPLTQEDHAAYRIVTVLDTLDKPTEPIAAEETNEPEPNAVAETNEPEPIASEQTKEPDDAKEKFEPPRRTNGEATTPAKSSPEVVKTSRGKEFEKTAAASRPKRGSLVPGDETPAFKKAKVEDDDGAA